MTEDERKRYDLVSRRRRLTTAAGEREGSPTLSPLACGPSARSLERSLAKMLPLSRAPPPLRGARLYPTTPSFPSSLIAQRTRAHFYPQHWLRAIWVCISSGSSSQVDADRWRYSVVFRGCWVAAKDLAVVPSHEVSRAG